jgi:hypothetical protein
MWSADRQTSAHHDIERALVPVPQHAPERFEPWPDETRERCYELWSTLGGRDSARTERLLTTELGGVPVPTASSIRRWVLDEAWAARADADLKRSHGRTLYELQVGWLAGLRLAQKTLLDGMAGEFDDLPMSGAARIKSAEITLRVLERCGMLALLPQAPAQEKTINWDSLSLEEREAFMRQTLQARKGQT